MKNIQQSEIGEILQQIYDSEIHLKMGWFWDGGFDFQEDSKTNDFWGELVVPRRTDERDITKGIEQMCRHLVLMYPKSTFAKWFNQKYENT